MKTFTIRIDSIDKVKRFVNIVTTLNGDFDLVSERYVVDAKSIMGIFSLDLDKDLKLNVSEDADFEDASAKLKEFIV